MNASSFYLPPSARPFTKAQQYGIPWTLKFKGNQEPNKQLAQAILKDMPANTTSEPKLLEAIKKNEKLPLPKGYQYTYGVIRNGKLETQSPELKTLIEPLLKAGLVVPNVQPVLLKIKAPTSQQTLSRFIEQVLKKDFAHESLDKKTGIVTNNVILSDLLEKLISGQTVQGLNQSISREVGQYLSGEKPGFQDLGELYRIQVPGNMELEKAFNQQNATRNKFIGLALAQKLYADSQEVEWHSIALSLGLGVLGEPTINAIFKDGGPVASAVRTGLMSGIDITGNILSVMGVVNENLKARNKKLSLETILGPKEKRQGVKSLFQMKGEAGPDLKQGIKAGVQGGLIGVLFNIPAGTILSMPNASLFSRSIIGGIGADGSAVAIPPVIKSSKEGFERSIEFLEQQGKIRVPKNIQSDPKKLKQYNERRALKELNGRIGMASSIKATHPLPLTGTGTVILAAEKLGIPREYVQTAYMALAPVMHNFLRLVYTGIEKYWTIPQRMKKLTALVNESQDKPFDQKQLETMDNAFLSKGDQWLSQGLCQMTSVATVGAVLLLAEVLAFAQALQKDKTDKAKSQVSSQPIVIPKLEPAPVLNTASSPQPLMDISLSCPAPVSLMPGFQPLMLPSASNYRPVWPAPMPPYWSINNFSGGWTVPPQMLGVPMRPIFPMPPN